MIVKIEPTKPARKTDKIHEHGKVKTGLFCPARIFVKEDLSKQLSILSIFLHTIIKFV